MDLSATQFLKKDHDGARGSTQTFPVAGREGEIDPVEIGKRLKDRMNAIGISQSELVRRSGVKHASVSRLLNGKNEPRLSVLWPVAYALGMTVGQALGFSPPPPPLLRPRDQEIVGAYYADPTIKKMLDRLVPAKESKR